MQTDRRERQPMDQFVRRDVVERDVLTVHDAHNPRNPIDLAKESFIEFVLKCHNGTVLQNVPPVKG